MKEVSINREISNILARVLHAEPRGEGKLLPHYLRSCSNYRQSSKRYPIFGIQPFDSGGADALRYDRKSKLLCMAAQKEVSADKS